MGKSENVVWHLGKIEKEERENKFHQKGTVIWLTGLSGSGKSTIAVDLEKRLFERGYTPYILDGDNVRHGLNGNLTFTEEDRKENIRRIGEVAKLFADAGILTITAFISPFMEDRQRVRDILDDDEFIEIYVKCSIEECERRDVKGLYKKARLGEIKNFTGIDSPYEAPITPELTVDSENEKIDDIIEKIIGYLKEKGRAFSI